MEREYCFLSNPYSEDRLRAIAESAGNVTRLKLTGPPEAYAAALESEIEKTRAEQSKEAEQWVHWRSSMLFRIDLRFEALYRRWEAEAIEQVQRRTDPLIHNYESCRAMKQTHANSEKINEDSFRQLVVETLSIPETRSHQNSGFMPD